MCGFMFRIIVCMAAQITVSRLLQEIQRGLLVPWPFKKERSVRLQRRVWLAYLQRLVWSPVSSRSLRRYISGDKEPKCFIYAGISLSFKGLNCIKCNNIPNDGWLPSDSVRTAFLHIYAAHFNSQTVFTDFCSFITALLWVRRSHMITVLPRQKKSAEAAILDIFKNIRRMWYLWCWLTLMWQSFVTLGKEQEGIYLQYYIAVTLTWDSKSECILTARLSLD